MSLWGWVGLCGKIAFKSLSPKKLLRADNFLPVRPAIAFCSRFNQTTIRAHEINGFMHNCLGCFPFSLTRNVLNISSL